MGAIHVCPWQSGHTLNSRALRLLHQPERILKGLVRPGMTVMDIGCGMGYFTLPMAEAVGEDGRVIAVDLQPEMLLGMQSDAEKTGGSGRIVPHPCKQNTLDISVYAEAVDFSILFMMLHEVPDPRRLIRELRVALRKDGRILFAEPVIHVAKRAYLESLRLFRQEGFHTEDEPRIALCRAAVLRKKP